MPKPKKPLGESLVEEGILTTDQLKRAQEEEKRSGQRLRKILVKMGFIAEEDLVSFLSIKLGIPRIELSNYLIDPKVIELVPDVLAKKHELIPVLKIGNRLTCAMVDPWNIFAIDEVATKTKLVIEPAVATETEIRRALTEHYGARGSMEELIKTMDKQKLAVGDGKEFDLKKLEAIVQEPVVIKLVNLLIMKAVQDGASDIHIEPEEEKLTVRFRVDGILREEPAPPKHLQSAVISRIKILANMDIAERRAPQEGRFQLKLESREVDVRVSAVPTIYGENVVLRLLDISSALKDLTELGFSKGTLEKYEKLIVRPHGIVLVTGPTGSGKTTTLYASLNKINTVDKNIITIEDPVEYRLAGVRQTQVNPKANITFANGLRSILRQDPNIIMVGEIRDLETAEIAVQASLTGHLVFSTVHTNDAAGAVTRLVDMGVEPFLVSSAVAGILAQRLVRAICDHCKESTETSGDALKGVGVAESSGGKTKLFRGKGCGKCSNLGYKGRVGIFELLLMDDKLRDLISAKASLHQIRAQARSAGMVSLKEDGVQKALAGLTTIEEVLRAAQEE
jgi:type IV pilus assembly protein PilB